MADTKSPDDVDIHIGGRVRLRRQMRGMSQEQLGAALGLTFQQIQKYEKGLNRIGAGRLYHISRALQVPVGFFFEGLPDFDEVSHEAADATRKDRLIKDFLGSPEGFALCESFLRISSSRTRRRLLDLVGTIAREDA